MIEEIPETAVTPLEGQEESKALVKTADSSRRARVRVCLAIEL